MWLWKQARLVVREPPCIRFPILLIECTALWDLEWMSVLWHTINIYGRIPIFMCGRKPECPEKTYQGGYGISKPNSHTTTGYIAVLVKGKCLSTEPTCLATRVVCHPDTEQNRPYKIHWPCWGLNWGPTALPARTLSVCHTTPKYEKFLIKSNK